MEPNNYLAQLGGVARTGQSLVAGYSRTDIAGLTKAGAHQPRRGVFMLPEYQPELAAAIRHNARVTCASAAAHYGLWLREIPAHHLACNPATEPASSGTGPSGLMAPRSCRWPRWRT